MAGRKAKSRKTGVPPASRSGNSVTIQPWALHLVALAVILIAGLSCYSNTYAVPFVLDDVTSILTNPQLPSFTFTLKPRILGELSFALNYRLHGFALAGYHVVNLALHLLNACFVYLLVQLLFRTPLLADCSAGKNRQDPAVPGMVGFGAALIFVTHPLQTQAVTYLAQRVAVLATVFYLGALLCYVGSRLSRKRLPAKALLGISLLLAMAGVLTKENAVTVPVVILLFEMTFFRGELRRRLLPLAWYLLPLAAAPLVLLGRIGFSVDLLGEVSRLTAGSGAPPRLTYLLTQFPVIVSYLRLFFFPVGQNLDHDVPLRDSLLDPVVIVSFVLLAAVAAAGIKSWLAARRTTGNADPLLALPAFGIGWFFITLSIESGAVPIRDVMFEHRLYLPSAGLVMALSSVGWICVTRLWRQDLRRAATVFTVALVLLGMLSAVATFRRNRVWQDEVTLWQDVVSKSPAKARAFGSLGHAYQRSGRLNEALSSYREAVGLAPDDHIARNNLGTIYLSMNQPDAALEQFKAALRSSPANTDINYNLGFAYEKTGRPLEAEAAYRQAISLNKGNDRAFNNLGILLYRQGRSREAVNAFREALRANPGNNGAGNNLVAIEKAGKKVKGR